MKSHLHLAFATVAFATVAALPPALVLADLRYIESFAWAGLAGVVAACVVVSGVRSRNPPLVSTSLGARAGFASFLVVIAAFALLQGRPVAWSAFFVVATTFMLGWYSLLLGGLGARFLRWLERGTHNEP
jgi:hypothetical protein